MSQDNGTATFDPKKARAVLALIAQDMADDARTLDGKLVTGATAGEFLGHQAAAVKRIAEIVHSLMLGVDVLEQRVDAVMEQQGLQTGKLHRLADGFAAIAYETSERLPVDGADWLDPMRGKEAQPEHAWKSAAISNGDGGYKIPCVCGWDTGWFDIPTAMRRIDRHLAVELHGYVPAEASVDADQAVA